nr:hypothetical protein Iba_chr13cCG12180 [Ipomoea batatas]
MTCVSLALPPTAHRRQPSLTGHRQVAPYCSPSTTQPHRSLPSRCLMLTFYSPASPVTGQLLRVSAPTAHRRLPSLTAQPLRVCDISNSPTQVIPIPSTECGCDSFTPTPMSSPVEYPNSSPVDSPSARNEAETQETQGTSQTVEGELLV